MAQKLNSHLILRYLEDNPGSSSTDIYNAMKETVALATVKRVLQQLRHDNATRSEGKGKLTRYRINPAFELLRDIDPDDYFEKEIDKRRGKASYNYELIGLLKTATLF